MEKVSTVSNAWQEAENRKRRPVFSGVLKYFPDAILAVAHCSWVGNQQHSPGQPLHWAKEKSTDEPDALVRHLLEAGTYDTDGVRHSAKVAWRALAMLQREIEAERNQQVESPSKKPHCAPTWAYPFLGESLNPTPTQVAGASLETHRDGY